MAITAGVNHLTNMGQGAMVYGAIKDAGNITNPNSAKALQSSIMGNSTLKQNFAPMANFAKGLVSSSGTLGGANNLQKFMKTSAAFANMSDTQAKNLDYNLQDAIRSDGFRPDHSVAATALSDGSIDPKIADRYIQSFLDSSISASTVATNITANGWGSMHDEVLDAMINGIDDGHGNTIGGLSLYKGSKRGKNIINTVNTLLSNKNANLSTSRRQRLGDLVNLLTK